MQWNGDIKPEGVSWEASQRWSGGNTSFKKFPSDPEACRNVELKAVHCSPTLPMGQIYLNADGKYDGSKTVSKAFMPGFYLIYYTHLFITLLL